MDNFTKFSENKLIQNFVFDFFYLLVSIYQQEINILYILNMPILHFSDT